MKFKDWFAIVKPKIKNVYTFSQMTGISPITIKAALKGTSRQHSRTINKLIAKTRHLKPRLKANMFDSYKDYMKRKSKEDAIL